MVSSLRDEFIQFVMKIALFFLDTSLPARNLTLSDDCNLLNEMLIPQKKGEKKNVYEFGAIELREAIKVNNRERNKCLMANIVYC